MKINDKIKLFRKQKNLSQVQMAKVIGISQAAYAKIETGVTGNITLNIATGIAKALNEDFNELFEIESDSQTIAVLKSEVEQLNFRIKEKDLLIRNITNQHKQIKNELIADVFLYYFNKLQKAKEEFKNSDDETERKALTEEMNLIPLQEKKKFKFYVASGILEQSDIDDVYDQMKENYEEYLLGLKRFA